MVIKCSAALPEFIDDLHIFRRNVQHFSGRLQDGFDCRYAVNRCFSYLFEVEEASSLGIDLFKERVSAEKEGRDFCGQPVCPKEVIPLFLSTSVGCLNKSN